jgi:argininosuccinate synthase
VTFGKDKSTTMIEATQQSRKERKALENLKKKRSKQKLQLYIRKKVGFTSLMYQGFVKKASLIYLFNFFHDMSWPPTQGEVEILLRKGNYYCLQNHSKQQLFMAAVFKLNAPATGVRIDIITFGKQNNHIILDDLKLAKSLNDYLIVGLICDL